MITGSLRYALLAQATDAASEMVKHADIILDLVDIYIKGKMSNEEFLSRSDSIKIEQIENVIFDLASLPNQLSLVVQDWVKNREPAYSQSGIEINILNELVATIEAAMLFFMREGYNLGPHFSLSKLKQAHAEIVRCSKLL